MRAKAFLVAAVVLGLLVISLRGVTASASAPTAVVLATSGSSTPQAVELAAPRASSWTLLGTQSPPRYGHGFVYDSKADRFILFGGGISGSALTNSTWTYDYGTNTWANVTPVVSPSPRAGAAMVYDSKADRVVLFGGTTSPGVYSNETWVFDLTNDTWTQRLPSPAPAARVIPAIAYDAGVDRTILFGGADIAGFWADTWTYDYSTDVWTLMNVTSPGALYIASMTYVASAGRDVLFGGVSIAGITTTWHFETWAYDAANNTWTNRNPPVHPSARGGAAFSFDNLADRAILFGGTDALTSMGPGGAKNDTWAYSYAQNGWTNVTPTGGPSARLLAAMDFDVAANRTVLFGGATINGVPYDDAWAFFYSASLPGAPRNLIASPGAGRITLTWQAPLSDGGSPITNYAVYRGTASGGEALLTTIGNVLTYDDTAVSAGTTYYYEVTAITAAGEGPVSNEASATPLAPPAPPSAPQNLAAAPGDAQVVLTWQAPASSGGSAITGYDVYRGTTSGAETLLTSLGVVLTYTDTAVTNGLTYYYEVSAVNGVGEGPKSNEVSATPTAGATAPSAPQSLVATAGNAQVTLTWQAPTSNGGAAITNYRVYRGTTSGSEALLTTLGNVLTYTDSTVTNGVTYYYEVSAVNSVGEGPSSSEAHATPTAPVADTTRPSISITSPANQSTLTTTTTVTVSGTASDNVAVQKVELSTDGTTWTLASGTTSWSGSVTLREGANTIYARATDTSGNVRTVSITVTVQTPSPTPQGLDPVLLAGILVVVVIAALAVALVLWRRRKKAAPPPTPPPP